MKSIEAITKSPRRQEGPSRWTIAALVGGSLVFHWAWITAMAFFGLGPPL